MKFCSSALKGCTPKAFTAEGVHSDCKDVLRQMNAFYKGYAGSCTALRSRSGIEVRSKAGQLFSTQETMKQLSKGLLKEILQLWGLVCCLEGTESLPFH